MRTLVRDPALAPSLGRCQCEGCIHDHVVVSCLVNLLFIWNAIDELKSYRTIVESVSYVGTNTLACDLRAFIFANTLLTLNPGKVINASTKQYPTHLLLPWYAYKMRVFLHPYYGHIPANALVLICNKSYPWFGLNMGIQCTRVAVSIQALDWKPCTDSLVTLLVCGWHITISLVVVKIMLLHPKYAIKISMKAY